MGVLNIMKLNVGGQIFKIDQVILEQSAYLQKLGNDGSEAGVILIEEEDSISFFIDRDPEIFQDILHYLRKREVHSTDEHYLNILKSEAVFYGIDGSIKQINQIQSTIALSDNLSKETYKSKAVDYIPVGFDTSKLDTTANETLVQAFAYTVRHDRKASKIVVKKS